jgi:hypothetical protein
VSRNLLCTDDERLAAAIPDGEVVLQAAETLEHDAHEIVFLDRHSDPETVDYLRSLTGARRRDLTIVLVAGDVCTQDREQAWRESVDLVVHVDDLTRIDALVRDYVDEKERFYERFRKLARAQGEY